MLAWLGEGHATFQSALATLRDDAELTVERPAPSGTLTPTARVIEIVINHDLYHAGEINRQRTLLRGAEGWTGR